MQYTPEERRQRILALAERDTEYQKMAAEYGPARLRFEKFVDRLPKRLRNLLWTCPGMLYFMHHRMLTLICETMRFPEED